MIRSRFAPTRCAAGLATLLALMASPASFAGGNACDPLPEDTYPIRYDVSFQSDIRPWLESQDLNCTTCHGGSGGLNLQSGVAFAALLGPNEQGQPSQGDSSILRVRPFEPLASALFLKINCSPPPFGNRMPPSGGSASGEFQALVYDWIAAGALMPEDGGERLFIGRFESVRRP